MSTAPTSAPAASELASCAGSYLTFALAEETYGVPILSVREIIRMQATTRLPGAAAEVMGVINLRGRVITIIDLRRRFGLPAAEAHPENVTIVVEHGGGRLGLAVDRVRDVATFAVDALEPPPQYGLSIEATFVRAIGKTADKVSILLDIARAIAVLEPKDASKV